MSTTGAMIGMDKRTLRTLRIELAEICYQCDPRIRCDVSKVNKNYEELVRIETEQLLGCPPPAQDAGKVIYVFIGVPEGMWNRPKIRKLIDQIERLNYVQRVFTEIVHSG
jgi:hypothetical protein